MPYQLATSVHFRYNEVAAGKVNFFENLDRILRAGFTNLDFNFLDMIHPDAPFLQEDYRDWIYRCRDHIHARHARWVQAHSLFIRPRDDFEYAKKMVKRSLECCATLGIPWTVMHHIWDPSWIFGTHEDPAELNYRIFSELLETAAQYKVGIAIENTAFPFYEGQEFHRSLESLLTLVDRLNSPYAGVCWDVGHGNINSVFPDCKEIAVQSNSLKAIGSRLKATHIHDNNAKMYPVLPDTIDRWDGWTALAYDEHIAPYQGTVDWDDVIAGLDAIGYDHYFTFEAHRAINSLPDPLVDDAMQHLRKVGQVLVAKSTLR